MRLWLTTKTNCQPSDERQGPGEMKGRTYFVEVVILIDQLLQLALYREYAFCWEFKFN